MGKKPLGLVMPKAIRMVFYWGPKPSTSILGSRHFLLVLIAFYSLPGSEGLIEVFCLEKTFYGSSRPGVVDTSSRTRRFLHVFLYLHMHIFYISQLLTCLFRLENILQVF